MYIKVFISIQTFNIIKRNKVEVASETCRGHESCYKNINTLSDSVSDPYLQAVMFLATMTYIKGNQL